MNFFQTKEHTHKIPNLVLRRAIILSPNKDWTDPKTEAYQYLKTWALEQDARISGISKKKKELPAPTEEIIDGLMNKMIVKWEGYEIPRSVVTEARELSPGMSIKDKRTKAYKYLKNWVKGKNNESET